MSRIFSGIQPSGELHIGNYLGAVQNWVRLQEGRDTTFFCIVDLHALTGNYEPADLRRRRHEMAVSLLAAGLDPESVHTVLPERRAAACRAGVGLQHGHAARRARTADAVQGQERSAGERDHRGAHVSGAAGGGHPPVSRCARAGGRGSGAAPGAQSRDRAAVEHALCPRVAVLPRAAAAADPRATADGPGRAVEDVEVDWQHHRPARSRANRSGRSCDRR